MNTYRDNKTGRFTHSPGNRTQRLIAELYRAFNYFNKTFADNELPDVIITIQNKGRRNALGWFGNDFWQDKLTTNAVGEINLSAEYMSRGPEECLETLLHEMAHLWNASNGIKDCSGSQYHNKRFKIAAERFGLVVKRHGSKGWATTLLDAPARKAIDKLEIDTELFSGLKRRAARKPVKRYVSLVVDISSMNHIDSIKRKMETSETKVSQKEIVATALELLNNNIT
jgi:hypothetical protein